MCVPVELVVAESQRDKSDEFSGQRLRSFNTLQYTTTDQVFNTIKHSELHTHTHKCCTKLFGQLLQPCSLLYNSNSSLLG